MTARAFPLWLGLFAGLAAVATGWVLGDSGIERAQLAARYTARVGLPIFLLTYTISSIVRLWPVDRWKSVLRHRRQWGLGFAIAHTIHLVALVTFSIMAAQMPSPVTLVGGGGAYVMLYAMALTSTDTAMRALGRWWKRLHTLGIHWLWFIFTFSYVGRIFEPDRRAQGVILSLLCLAALGVRLAAGQRARRLHPSL